MSDTIVPVIDIGPFLAGDPAARPGDQWIGMPYGLVELELAMARHRLDDDQTILDADTLEPITC
jgi:hypothetical protein